MAVPTLNLSARVNTVTLHCKKCGADMTDYLSKYYPYSTDMDKNDTYIHYDLVTSDSPCRECGSNLMDAKIGIIISQID